MNGAPHDFEERLAWGESMADEPFWEQIYRQAFPTFSAMAKNEAEGNAQRCGIDRVILLQSGRSLYVDEKKRSIRDTGDFLLEFLSNDRTGAPGWIEKDLQIDYLAYAFIPVQRCYLFPWHCLRGAWLTNKVAWLGQFKPKIARNRTYGTHSLPVPRGVLVSAVVQTLRVQLPTLPPEPSRGIFSGTPQGALELAA